MSEKIATVRSEDAPMWNEYAEDLERNLKSLETALAELGDRAGTINGAFEFNADVSTTDVPIIAPGSLFSKLIEYNDRLCNARIRIQNITRAL